MQKLTEKDIVEGEKLMEIYLALDEIDKARMTSYISALRDKQMSPSDKNKPA